MNEPAFPNEAYGNAGPHTGMTLRDYFAAKAMESIMTAQYPVTRQHDAESRIALAAYKLADAMMEARNVAQ